MAYHHGRAGFTRATTFSNNRLRHIEEAILDKVFLAFFPFVLLSFFHEIVYCDFVTPERERDRGRTFDREWVGAQYEGQASNLRARGHNARAPYPTNSTLEGQKISLPQKR